MQMDRQRSFVLFSPCRLKWLTSTGMHLRGRTVLYLCKTNNATNRNPESFLPPPQTWLGKVQIRERVGSKETMCAKHCRQSPYIDGSFGQHCSRYAFQKLPRQVTRHQGRASRFLVRPLPNIQYVHMYGCTCQD